MSAPLNPVLVRVALLHLAVNHMSGAWLRGDVESALEELDRVYELAAEVRRLLPTTHPEPRL